MKFVTILIIAGFIGFGCSSSNVNPVRIIFDTDLGPDYDDVGALSLLHCMADSGKAEILATIASNKYELVAPSIEVINTYFGRPGLPIGAPKKEGANMVCGQHWADSITARYPHTINSTDDAPDAIDVYRKVLSSQPDKSVTIVTVGFLTNIAALLKSKGDSYSNLSGQELIKKKVVKLISMAGGFPSGREFNIFIDSVSSKYAIENWPGEIVFSGFEIGSKIFTGLKLTQSDISNSPVKDVYRISMAQSEEDRNGRMSWDQTAVLISVYGPDKFFDTVRGEIIINPDGSNKWIDNEKGKHQYVRFKMNPEEVGAFIETGMMHQPVRK